MINYCKVAGNAEVVAICDKWQESLEKQKEENRAWILRIMTILMILYQDKHTPKSILQFFYSEKLPMFLVFCTAFKHEKRERRKPFPFARIY